MKVDEFKRILNEMKAVFKELEDEIDVIWFPTPNEITCALFYITDGDVSAFKLRPNNIQACIKSLMFKDDKMLINDEHYINVDDTHHLRIVPYKSELLLMDNLRSVLENQ